MDMRSIVQWMFDPATRAARRRRSARGEGGSAILETAMSMMILLTFLFGVMEVSFALYAYHFISEAAREGTRYAIVRGTTCSGFVSACPASTSDIQDYVKNLGFPGINPADMTVTPVWSAYTAGTTCPASPSPCNSPGNLITVTVQYNFHLNVPFVPPKTYAMSSTAAMVIQQ